MSRNYECQVEVFPCSPADMPEVMETVLQWGMAIECDTAWLSDDRGEGWSFWGSIQLVGGQTEEDKHNELHAALPDKSVTTKWRWIDEQPWNDVFTSEPPTGPIEERK